MYDARMRAHQLFEKMAARTGKPVPQENTGMRSAATGAAIGAAGFGTTALATPGVQRATAYQPSEADKGLYEGLKSSTTTPVYEGRTNREVMDDVIHGRQGPQHPGRVNDVLHSVGSHNAGYVDVEGPLTRRTVGKALNTDKSFVAMGSGLKGNPHVLAHELGHAAHDKTMLGKVTQSLPAGLLRNPALSLGSSAAIGATTGLSDNENVRRAGRWAPLALSAPMLASEAAASLHGHGSLKRLGASAEQLAQYRKTMLPAFGTYAGHAALSPAVSHIAQGAVVDAREQDKQASGEIKLSGFGAALKELALKDIGGPKGFLQPAARIAAGGQAGTGKLLKPVQRAAVKTPRAAGAAWDVSRQARSMGL